MTSGFFDGNLLPIYRSEEDGMSDGPGVSPVEDDLRDAEELAERAGSEVRPSGGAVRLGGYQQPDEPPELREDPIDTGGDQPTTAQMWAIQGSAYMPCDRAVEALPPGQYIPMVSDHRGVYLEAVDSVFDDLVDLPDSAADAVLSQIEEFWSKEQHFRDLGFLWKRGVLLYGPPGSGKTCTLQQVSERMAVRGGISVYCSHPALTAKALSLMRRIEPDRPAVVLMEDLDAMVQRYGETEVLSLLDGELQVDNVVFIATTNYPERMDARITNRPSRFDVVRKIGMPSEKARDAFLKAKHPTLPDGERAEWVGLSDGFSIAHLKEMIVSSAVFEIPIGHVVKRLRAMADRPKVGGAETIIGAGAYR